MGVAPTIQTLRTSASSTALRASTTTNNQNLSQEKPDVKSVGEQLEELDSRIWNELGIESGSDFAGQPEKIKSYASSVKDYLDANGIKELDRETFSFLEAINYHTLNNILGLHGVYGEEFRRRAIERADSPYSNYDRNTALEIVNGIDREEILDKGIERMQENGGVSDSAAEAEMNARDNLRADYLDAGGNPHWFDEEEEEEPEIGQYSPEAINFSPDSSAELVKYYSEFEIPLEEDEAKKMLEVLERNGMTLSYDPVVNDIVVNVYKIDGEKHNYFPEDLREIQEIVASLDGGNVSIPTHPGEINNLVNKIKTPDQLVYAAARVGRMIEQHTQNVQSVVNRDMVSRLSTFSEPTNKEYDSSKLLSSAEMFFPAIRKLETIIKETYLTIPKGEESITHEELQRRYDKWTRPMTREILEELKNVNQNLVKLINDFDLNKENHLKEGTYGTAEQRFKHDVQYNLMPALYKEVQDKIIEKYNQDKTPYVMLN